MANLKCVFILNWMLIGVLLVSCTVSKQHHIDESKGTALGRQTNEVAQVAAILRNMAEWLEAPQKRLDIMKSLRSISQLLHDTIRAAELCYISTGTSEAELVKWEKLLLTHRYIFAVPSRAKPEDVRFFGGWGRAGAESNLDMLWPFEEKPDGSLNLRYLPSGYLGPDFRAIDEFDYFWKRFGRRAKRTYKRQNRNGIRSMDEACEFLQQVRHQPNSRKGIVRLKL